jgi:cytidyltransferase-like protein
MTLGIVSGYFAIIHAGHIHYLQHAKRHCDYLAVIVNNDIQLQNKKGDVYVPEHERMSIIKCIKYVDQVFLSIDEDETVNKTVEKVWKNYAGTFDNIVFINDGDVVKDSDIREYEICKSLGIKPVLMNNRKINSSSNIIEKIRRG